MKLTHAQNFIKCCIKIVYHINFIFVRYVSIYLFQLLNLRGFFNFRNGKKMNTQIWSCLMLHVSDVSFF